MKKIKEKLNKKKIIITLSKKDIVALSIITKQGKHKTQVITRARILLLSHQGKTNSEIVAALGCAERTLCTIRNRYQQEKDVLKAIHDLPRSGQPKKINPFHEAYVVATACTNPPAGHNHWTLPELKRKLLAKYKKLRSVSNERIRHILLNSELKPWREKNVVYTEPHTSF